MAVGKIAAGAVVLAVGAYLLYQRDMDRAAERDRRAGLDAATVLPSSVRQEWFRQLDRAIDERVLVHDGRLRILEYGGAVTYLPLPIVELSCDPLLGIWIGEAGVEEGSTMTLIGFDGLSEPELPVGATSPAATQLFIDLCDHLSDEITALGGS